MSLDLGETFNTEEMDLGDDLLPAGAYIMQAVNGKIKDTNNGKMLTLEFEILDGMFERRRVFHRYNYLNSSATAQSIAKKELGQLAVAVKRPQFRDAEDFFNIPFVGDVGIEADKNGRYSDQNILKRCYPIEEAQRAKDAEAARVRQAGSGPAPSTAPSSPPPPPPRQQAAASAGAGKKPWN